MLSRMDAATWHPGDPDSEALAIDYLRQRVPCPFLIDESCSIHPIRPLICREYLVTSPPEFCALPTRDRVEPVPMPIKLSTPLYRLGAQLEPNARAGFPWSSSSHG